MRAAVRTAMVARCLANRSRKFSSTRSPFSKPDRLEDIFVVATLFGLGIYTVDCHNRATNKSSEAAERFSYAMERTADSISTIARAAEKSASALEEKQNTK